MVTHEDLVSQLIASYSEINKIIIPEWAVRKRTSGNLVSPTIPFVGKKYIEQSHKILIYASAENLTNYLRYSPTDRPWLDDDSEAINRHRKCFDEIGLQYDPFFPHVHLQPMNNGCLCTAAHYIVSKLYNITEELPINFYEKIAFGNYGKYSIATKKQLSEYAGENKSSDNTNKDYASNKTLLTISREYIRKDIAILKPNCIIIPSSIYNADKAFIDTITAGISIFPIYQMNTRVINMRIAKSFELANVNQLPRNVKFWYDSLEKDGMTGKNKENYLSVFSYLDHIIEQYFV